MKHHLCLRQDCDNNVLTATVRSDSQHEWHLPDQLLMSSAASALPGLLQLGREVQLLWHASHIVNQRHRCENWVCLYRH